MVKVKSLQNPIDEGIFEGGMKKNKLLGRISIIVITMIFFSISGCSSNTKEVSDGQLYINKNIGFKIIPPRGWVIEKSNNLGIQSVYFKTFAMELRVVRNSTALTNLSQNQWGTKYAKYYVNHYKENLRKNNDKISREGKALPGSMPVYFMEVYNSSEGYRVKRENYFIVHEGFLYTIICLEDLGGAHPDINPDVYSLKEFEDTKKNNVNLMQKTLSTFEFLEKSSELDIQMTASIWE